MINEENINIVDELSEALCEVKNHIEGKLTLSHRELNIPDQINVKEIRSKFGYSQNEFASHFGFTTSAIKDWEQGRRRPEKSARILLTIIDKKPQIIEELISQIF